MPLRAMEDMQNAKVSEAAREMEWDLRRVEEKGAGVDGLGEERRVEDVELAGEKAGKR
jgi:hypothetical protein